MRTVVIQGREVRFSFGDVETVHRLGKPTKYDVDGHLGTATEYEIVEYQPERCEPTEGERAFMAFVNGRACGVSTQTFDGALMAALAFKHDAAGGPLVGTLNIGRLLGLHREAL